MDEPTCVYQVIISCPDGTMGNLHGTVEHGPIFATEYRARKWVKEYRGGNYPHVVRQEVR